MGGWLGAIGSVFSWLGGEGIAQSLVRVAIGLGLSSLLRNSQDNPAKSTSTTTPRGSRLQVPPATDNKLPVAYGDSYFSGTITDARLENDNKEMYSVIALCEKTGDIFSSNVTVPANRTLSSITIDDIYIGNQRVTFKADGTTIDYTTDETGVVDTNLSGLVGIYLYQGNSNNPMLPCQTGTTTPITGTLPPVAYSVMPGWDNTFTMDNIIFAIVKMNYDPSKGARSIPQCKFHVRNTMNKPGDVLHDYCTNLLYGAGIDESQVDATSVVALNSYSDELVTYAPYAAQKRYVINGLIRTTETVLTNMEKIAASAGSNITYDVSTGKWSVVINKATAKTLDFDDSNVLGQINVTSSNLDSYYNQIEVQFPYSVLKDQFNFVRVVLPGAMLNTDEQPNMYQLTHELTNNVVQASVLANLDLRQSREDLIITFNTDFSKYNVQIGDVFGLTNTVYGWTGKLFRVIRLKKNESDAGQLTIEITGQAYNADVYTVEPISDFVPLLGVGNSFPSLSPIATPLAPNVFVSTTEGLTITSQPSVYITGIVPTGVVNEMEYWYTADSAEPNDDLRNYTLLGSMRAENSGPFTVNAAPVFKTVLLATGDYYFKVRAANASGSSRFSPASVLVPYVYVAAPDVLPYSTPVSDVNGDLVVPGAEGMSVGLMAAYLASKLNWFGANGILSGNGNIESIFGISSNNASDVNNSVANDAAAYNSANVATAAANAAVTSANAAVEAANVANQNASNAQTAAANAELAAQQALAAVNALGGNIVTLSSTLTGHVFPSMFGVGSTYGAGTHAAIFTHDNLVFAGNTIAAPTFDANNIVYGNATTLSATVDGYIQNFYTIPSSSGWAVPPVYNQTVTDKFTYDSKLSLYYATATYTSGNLDAQSWSTWTLLNTGNGVTGTAANTAVTVYTNPYVETLDPYIVDEIYQLDGVGNVVLGPDSFANGYDPFKPNIAITTYTTTDTRQKSLYVTVTGNKSFAAGNTDLIIFGTSVFNLPTGTAFANNTAFGHIAPVYLETYPNALSFKVVVNNGSRFVAIQNNSDRVYWSDDGISWTRVALPSQVTTDGAWIDMGAPLAPNDPFEFLVYDGTQFIVYDLFNGVATSTDGKIWVEDVSSQGLDDNTKQVIATDGNYLAVGPAGVQTSANGKDWSAPVSSFSGQPVNTGCWDGSQFIIGSRYSGGAGCVLHSSPDGSTWTAMTNLNSPQYSQNLSAAQNAALQANVTLVSGLTAALP